MGLISAHNSLFVQLSIVLLTFKTITAHNSFQKPSKFIEESSSFITRFISNEQSSCEIMFLSASMDKPINQIDFSYISSVLGPKQYHAGLYYIDMHFGHKFKRFEDIHRMSVQGSCATVLVLLDHWEETVPQKLFNLITPPYTSITRKDEDHFIFLSPSKSVLERLLLSPKFGNKIKFKIGLDNNSFKRETEVLVKTASLYDSRAGPKIISFPVVNQHSNKNKMFPDFTRNFRGFPLKLAIPKAPFRFELEMRADGRYHPKRGTYKPWLDTAMAKLNFTYDCFYSSYGGGTGIQFKNGSWVGAVADVRDNVADMAFFIAHIYNRHTVVDWSAPLSNEWIVFVSHKPQFYYSTYAILWPFKLTVWICFLVSIICVTICLTMIASTIGKQSETKTVKNLWSTTKSLEYIFATFLEQDQDGPSKLLCNPIRVLCATWLWFALVTATAYKAKLVSVMAFPVASQVPRTYDQLVDSSYGVGMHVIGKGDAAHTVFKEGKGHVYEGIFARLQIVSSPLKCLLRAVHEDFGCLMWEGLNDYLNVKNITSRGTKKTPTQVSLSKTSFINDGLIYERRAIIRKSLDDTIIAARDSGLTKKWVDIDFDLLRKARFEWESSQKEDSTAHHHQLFEDNGPKALTFKNCKASMYILLMGICISTFFIVGENIRFRMAQAQSKINFNSLDFQVVEILKLASTSVRKEENTPAPPSDNSLTIE